MLETLDRKNIPFDELVLFSSARSAGKKVEFQGQTYTVQELTDEAASEHFDYVLMSAGGGTSEHFAPLFEQAGAIVIDNSSQWRMTEDVDLVVPEVNEPKFTRGIIANPNCSTIQSVVPLKILKDAYGLKRVAYTTYQAVSGSGIKGKRDLSEGANGKNRRHTLTRFIIMFYLTSMFFLKMVIPKKNKMIDETRKILNDKDLKVTATCVRVPVQDSHSIEIDVTLDKDATVKDIQRLFEQDDRVVLVDNPEKMNIH